MKSFINNFFKFTKIEHTVFSLPLLFAGAYLGAGRQLPGIRVICLIIIAGIGARILGMSMNRILDRSIDAKNPRTKNREIPSGKMTITSAYIVAAIGFATYMIACYLLSPLVLMLSWIPAAALIIYSVLKRFTPLCHFGIGVCMALAPLGAYVAVTGTTQVTTNILLLAGFAFCWISGFDIIYALLDIDFDRTNNVRSIPASLGSTKAQMVAALVHLTALLFLALLAYKIGLNFFVIAAYFIALIAFIAAYMPFIPIPKRFFPISAVTGIVGSIIVFF